MILRLYIINSLKFLLDFEANRWDKKKNQIFNEYS